MLHGNLYKMTRREKFQADIIELESIISRNNANGIVTGPLLYKYTYLRLCKVFGRTPIEIIERNLVTSRQDIIFVT